MLAEVSCLVGGKELKSYLTSSAWCERLSFK
jgi:hypothetical protein